jgi:hypothetical protein
MPVIYKKASRLFRDERPWRHPISGLFQFFNGYIGLTRWDLLSILPTAPRGIRRAGRWFSPTTSSLRAKNASTFPLHRLQSIYYVLYILKE